MDINQLELAIHEMASKIEACQYISQVLEEDNVQFLRIVIQILKKPGLPAELAFNCVILISTILRTTFSRSKAVIQSEYLNVPQEEREQLIQILIDNGFNQADKRIRDNYAHCFYFITQLEYPNIKFIKILSSLLENPPSKYAQLEVMNLYIDLLKNKIIQQNNRFFRNYPELFMKASYIYLGKLENIDQEDIQFKIIYAKGINTLFKCEMLYQYFIKKELKIQFVQCIKSNIQIRSKELHKYLIKCFKGFISLLYKQYSATSSQDEIVPFIDPIYQSTIQPVSSIQRDDFNFKETESYARDVIKMWTKVAEVENKFNQSNESHQLNLISEIAKKMDEYLFSYISMFQSDDLFVLYNNDISFYAYDCLCKFSKIDPTVVFEHAYQVFSSCINNVNHQSVFVSFVSAQIIFKIEDLQDDDFNKILNEIIQYMQNKSESLKCPAFLAISTACLEHPIICSDPSFFKYICQQILDAFQSHSKNILFCCLETLSSLIKPFNESDENSILSEYYKDMIQSLLNFAYRNDIIHNYEMEEKIYKIINNIILKLPSSLSNKYILEFGSQIYEQIQSLINNKVEEGLQLRAWLSIIVHGITSRLEKDIEPLAPGFFTVLISTFEEVISTDDSINSSYKILESISLLIYFTERNSSSFIHQIFNICMKCFSTGDHSLIFGSAIIIYYLFNIYKADLVDSISDTINALLVCLFNSNIFIDAIYGIFLALTSIFQIGSDESDQINQYIGEILLNKRKELMDYVFNLARNLPCLYKGSAEFDMCNLFSSILSLLTSIIKIYNFEREYDKNDLNKKHPSGFIATYCDDFIELVTIGSNLNLFNEDIGFGICDYMIELDNHFHNNMKMNVKLHKPAFKKYLNLSTDSDSTMLIRRARYVNGILNR